uniref:Uncharacterized protein n=1 Tax=Schistocephalus solidus TaxID=70667 RepID=A0A0X3NX11_SCHSO
MPMSACSHPETASIWHALPYSKVVAGATERIFSHRPRAAMRTRVVKSKDPLNHSGLLGVLHHIPSLNCPDNYTDQTECILRSRRHEHEMNMRRGNELPQVTAHNF